MRKSLQKGSVLSLQRRVTRRRALALFGLSIGGSIALAACDSPGSVGETAAPSGGRTEETPAGSQDSVTERTADRSKVAAMTSEQSAARESVEVVFSTDSIYGPRGAAMQWGLRRFAEIRPEIYVKLEPSDNLQTRFLADSLPHVALVHQHDFLRFRGDGTFTEVTDLLEQMHVDNDDYYFLPDTHTFNDLDHSFPPTQTDSAPQYGMPFEFEINGFVGNISLAEESGVYFPISIDSWTWDDWTQWDAQMTDADAGTYGSWARQDYQYQYLPQMYSNGLKKPFDDGLTKTMFDQPEALEAWEYLINKIFQHRTSPPADLIKTLSGDYQDLFTAGRIGIWPSGRVYSTGFSLPFIKNRFRWTLLPAVVAARGGPPGHGAHAEPNLITRRASLDGLEEPSLALAVYLASEEFQGRVGIERGHMPVHKAALRVPESRSPPPEGMKWLKVYADRPDNRGLFPFHSWRDWWIRHQQIGRAGWEGRQAPAAALAACQAWGVEHLSSYEGPTPFVREPVYP